MYSAVPSTRATPTEPGPESWDWAARLLHFSDSALPVGAYAHSFGLEGVCQMGVVCDRESLGEFLGRDVAHALLSIDLPILASAQRAAEAGSAAELQRLDQLSWAMRPTRQLREAASKIGRQQWALHQRTWGEGALSIELPHRQSPVVMGQICAAGGVPAMPALWSLSYQTYSALLQAALKLLPIGPAASQQLLHAAMHAIGPSLPAVMRLPELEWGSFNPVWDIAASQHESAAARMFIS